MDIGFNATTPQEVCAATAAQLSNAASFPHRACFSEMCCATFSSSSALDMLRPASRCCTPGASKLSQLRGGLLGQLLAQPASSPRGQAFSHRVQQLLRLGGHRILSHNYTKDASHNYTKDAPTLAYHSQCDRIVLCPGTDVCSGNHMDIGFNGTTQQDVCAAKAAQLSNAASLPRRACFSEMCCATFSSSSALDMLRPASRCCTPAVPASCRSCTAVCLASSSRSQPAPRAVKPSCIESRSCNSVAAGS